MTFPNYLTQSFQHKIVNNSICIIEMFYLSLYCHLKQQIMGTLIEIKGLVAELMATEFTVVANGRTYKLSAKQIGYRFEFNNRKRAFGVCNYAKKVICLSLPLCNENLDRIHTNIRNTILHEIAHALSVQIHGMSGRGHGANWKSIAKQIGCNGERCFDGSVNRPASKYTLVCDTCGTKTPQHRKSRLLYACTKCCKAHNNGKFSHEYKLRYVVN